MHTAQTAIGTVLAGLLAALPVQAAPPTSGAATSAAASAATLEARLELPLEASSALRDSEDRVERARRALAGALSTDERISLLDRVTADQLRLRRWTEARASADAGLALQGLDSGWTLRFATLGAQAQLGMNQHDTVLKQCDERISAMLTALRHSQEPADRLRVLQAQRTCAMALVGLSRRAEAMELLTQVRRGFDDLKNAEGQAETLYVIAALRNSSGDIAEAARTLQLAIDTALEGRVKGVLPRLHSLMAYLQAHSGKHEAQRQALEAAGQSALEEGDAFVQAMVMFNLSDVAMQDQDWPTSLRLSEAARPIFLRFGDLNMADLCLANRGIALNRTGHPEGLALLRRANEALAGRPGQEVTRVAIQKALAEELAFNRDYEAAYAAQLEFQRRKEALHQADNRQRIAEAEAAYQADRRQRQIEALEQERVQQQRYRWLWILVGVLGLAAAAVVAVSRVYLKRAYARLHEMALQDPLTGLHNRRYLGERMETELAQLRRERTEVAMQARAGRTEAPRPAPGAAFLLIDMDHFKAVNDAHGHAAGDEVLKQASALLRGLVRPTDTLVRWGGEEFLVFARLASRSEAAELAERLCSRVAAHAFDIGTGAPLQLSCSVGFACYPFAGEGDSKAALPSWDSLCSLADQCLYLAKAHGRNRWVGVQCADGTSPDAAPTDLRTGVEQGQLSLHHRPDLEVRWPPRDPDGATLATP